jgi:hypothetical protein
MYSGTLLESPTDSACVFLFLTNIYDFINSIKIYHHLFPKKIYPLCVYTNIYRQHIQVSSNPTNQLTPGKCTLAVITKLKIVAQLL